MSVSQPTEPQPDPGGTRTATPSPTFSGTSSVDSGFHSAETEDSNRTADGGLSSKRGRTRFSTEQRDGLEKEFLLDKYPKKERQMEIASALELTVKQVNVFECNASQTELFDRLNLFKILRMAMECMRQTSLYYCLH